MEENQMNLFETEKGANLQQNMTEPEVDWESLKGRIISSYQMYENTIQQVEPRMRKAKLKDGTPRYTQKEIDSRISLIREAQNRLLMEYEQNGGNVDEIINAADVTVSMSGGVIEFFIF